MTVQPLYDRVLIQPIEEEKTTKAGIIIPETAQKERPEKGKVVAVGPGKPLENGGRTEMSVKVGDIVVFKKYSPDEIKADEEKLLIVEESDILAILS